MGPVVGRVLLTIICVNDLSVRSFSVPPLSIISIRCASVFQS